jgi:asparagine synthetase B (glutamine-hydrolysing)/GT2 family glycosyltransferase/glycosyltransferase involved in cell wall biosynthesis
MSGIAGILHEHGRDRVASHRLESMVEALVCGDRNRVAVHCDPHAALGLGLPAGPEVIAPSAPVTSEDGQLIVFFDGECHNLGTLRRELEGSGAALRTHSAAEHVLHGFRVWGARRLAERMIGAYVFCVYDRRAKRVSIVRDRLGVHALHYVTRNGRFAFSSRLMSLMRSGLVNAKVDETALWSYLGSGYTTTERSLVAGVARLPAGHLLEWRDGKTRVECYWEPPAGLASESADHAAPEHSLAVLTDQLLSSSSESGGEVGYLLRPHLTSALGAALLANRYPRDLRAFSLSIDDESSPATADPLEGFANRIGCRHESLTISRTEAIHQTLRTVERMDEPVADPAIALSSMLARGLPGGLDRVVADKGFGEFLFESPERSDARINAIDRASIRRRALENSRRSRLLSERLGRIVRAPRVAESTPFLESPVGLDAPSIWSVLHPSRRPELESLQVFRTRPEVERFGSLGEAGSRRSAAIRRSTQWLANSLAALPDDSGISDVSDVSDVSDAPSALSRVEWPWLDHRWVEFACAQPGISPRSLARTLLGSAREGLPSFVRSHSGVPLDAWLRGPLLEQMRDSLFHHPLVDAEILDPSTVEALFTGHVDLGLDLAGPIWQLMCLKYWHEQLCEEISTVDHPPYCMELTDRTTASESGQAYEKGRCDIVIPIYGGVTFVRDLLRSIERNTDYPHRIILVDDSDDRATHEELKRLAAATRHAELYRNESNLGFVGTSNRGFTLGRAEFICLINSDTIVTAGWLEKMIACAEHDPTVAIVNPLSNQSANLSVSMPPGFNINTMARRVEELSQNRYPDITTAVGFCMLVKRRYLDWLGGFDPIYGHGYCEESDLCMRYTEAGLRVVIAEDAFVYHKGCGSFRTWIERYTQNRKTFDARWAEAYERDYSDFLRRNPIQYVRDGLLRDTIPEAEGRAEGSEIPENGRTVLDEHLPRTGHDPESRTLRFPTPRYVENLDRVRLGRARDGGSPLRITFLVASMPVSGGITAIVQLAREMILQGHEVCIVTESPEVEPERFNLPLQPLVFSSKEELLRLFPASDVVVATYWTTAAEYLEELRTRYDFVAAYYLQDYEVLFYPEEDATNRSRVAWTYSVAEHLIAESQWVRDLVLENHDLECSRVHLGLDLGIFWDRKQTPSVNRVPRIVSVARPSERRRGFLEVVDVFDRIQRARPEVEFVFFGTTDEEMPSRLPFPYRNEGRIEDLNRVAELISSCDVLVDSSLFQGFGRPGLEAMASGTPCVLTSEGGLSEYAVDEENCLIVPPRMTGRMSAAILRLLDDVPLRERLRRAGLETAARFSHVDAANQHLHLYRRWHEERLAARASSSDPPNLYSEANASVDTMTNQRMYPDSVESP